MLLARDFRSIARDRLRGCFWAAVLVTLVAALLGGAISGNNAGASIDYTYSVNVGDYHASYSLEEMLKEALEVQSSLPFQLLSCYSLILLLIGGAVSVGLCRYNLALLDRQERSMRTLWTGFSSFGKALGLRLLTALFVFLWSLLLVIPGIIAAYRYSMAFFVLTEDPNIGVSEAIRVSKQMMRGNKWRLFCLQFSFIGWALLAALPAGLASGLLFSMPLGDPMAIALVCGLVTLLASAVLAPYINAATTAFYLDVSGQAHRLGNAEQPDAE